MTPTNQEEKIKDGFVVDLSMNNEYAPCLPFLSSAVFPKFQWDPNF